VATKKTKSTASSKKKAASTASTSAKTSTTSSAKKKTASAGKTGTRKKTASKKTTAKKTAPAKKKSTATKKKAVAKKQSAAKKKAPVLKPNGKKPASRARPAQNGFDLEEPVKPKVKPMGKRDLKKFKTILLELRERLQGDIRFLTTDNLHRAGRETGADLSGAAQHSADHGTDNFDREFALSLASAEEDVMYEVDEALMRIEEGTYGICEHTGVRIETARLEVIPYTRYSVQAQAKMEQSRVGYRPFGQSFKKW
jgi:RNA polymerase-binding transcription factor DksA